MRRDGSVRTDVTFPRRADVLVEHDPLIAAVTAKHPSLPTPTVTMRLAHNGPGTEGFSDLDQLLGQSYSRSQSSGR